MIKCDLCGKEETIDRIRSTQYSVPGVNDICPECAEIIFAKREELRSEINTKMYAFVKDMIND